MLNRKAQTAAAPHLARLAAAGCWRFRIELVDETADWVAPVVERFISAIAAAVAGASLGASTSASARSRRQEAGRSGAYDMVRLCT